MHLKPRILIVEDNERRLNSACQVLETAGFEPVCATNGAEAASLAAECSFDLALVNAGLVSAAQVCRQIKAAQPTFVVLLQGSENLSEELEAGADGLITIPVTDRELLAHVRAYLRIQQTQAALRASEARFRSVFENNSVGLYRTTPDGRILMANPALLRMLGIEDFADLAQRNLEQDYFNSSYPRSQFKLQIESQGELKALESAWKKEDGSFVYARESAQVVYDQAGKVLYYEGTVEDITEQKKAEQALRLLVDTQKQIAYLESPLEIYQLVGQVVHRMIGDGYVIVFRNDPQNQTFQAIGQYGFDGLFESILAAVKVDPFNLVWNVKDVSAEVVRLFNNSQLAEFTGGIFELTNRKFPQPICAEIEKQMDLSGIYTIGFTWKDDQFGNLVILAKSAIAPYIEMIETIVNQASISIKRIQSDQAVRQERDRAQLYFNSVELILAASNVQGELTMINQPGCRMLGYSAEELLGKDWVDDWVPVRDRDEVRVSLRQYLTGESEAEYRENQVVTKSGEELTVAWHNTLLRDDLGQVTGILAAGMDITQRKQAEQALEWERYLMTSLMDNVPDTIYFKDAHGRILRSNQAHAEHVGIKNPDSLIGKTDFDLFGDEHAWAAYEDEQAIMRSGQPLVDKEEREDFKDGHVSWVSTTKLPLRDIQGQIIGTFGVSRDITERKQAEEALRQSEAHYHSLFQNASFGIFHSSPDGRFIRANPALAHMLGYDSADELIACVTNIKAQLYVSPDRHTQIISTVAQQDDWLCAENQYRCKDGRRITGSLSIRRVTNPDGSLAYLEGFVEDITRRKQIENELRLDEKRLEGLLDISQHAAESIDDLLAFAVRQALDLTGSYLAYLFSYDEQKQELTLNLRSMETSGNCGITYPKSVYRLDETGLGGEPIRQRKPVLVNDFHASNPLKSGYPQGHVQIDRFLSIPIFSQEHIVAVVAVANKAVDYNQSDLRQVNLLMNSVWRMVETKQAEARLRESEERLRFALEAGNDGLWDHDGKMGQDYYSPRYYTMLGYRPNEFKATQAAFEKLVHPEDFARVQQALDDYNSGLSEKYEIEFRMLAKCGEVVWILSRAKAVEYDPQGHPWRVVGTHTDITERKQAEEAVRESEVRLKEAERMAHLGSSTWDVITDTTYWSDEMYRITGWNQGTPLPKRSERGCLYTPESWARLKPALDRALNLAEPYDMDLDLVRPDGSLCPVHVHGEAETDANGQVVYLHGTVQDISELRLAQESLRQTNQLLNALIKASPLGISAHDRQGCLTLWSPACERLFGWTQAEVIGHGLPNIPDGMQEEVGRQIHEELQGAQRTGFVNPRRRKDGTILDISLSTAPLRDVQGEITGSMAIYEDITQRKQVVNMLKESEARLVEAQAIAHVGNWELNLADKTLWASAEAFRIYGIERNLPYLTLEQVQKVTSVEDRPRLDAALSGLIRGQGQYDEEFQIRGVNDGVQRVIHSIAHLVCDGNGTPYKITGVIQDITERKRAEQALRESEQHFRSFIEQSAEGVMILDEEGRIIEWNNSSEQITGVARQEAIGSYYWDMQDHFVSSEKHSQQIIDRTRHAILRALRTGQSAFFNRAIEAEIICSNGERHFIRQTVFPIKTEKGFRIGGVSQDITELKQAEALRLAKESAEAANRSKSEFLANMSHELRTPLNAVIGFSDMLRQQYYGPLTAKQVEYVKDIHESATYLLALINDILDLSKIEAGRMDLETSRIDLQTIFEHSLIMVRERAAKHALYLSAYIDPRLEPLNLMADERKVRQVLYNLLANAVKFTPDGGAVDISACLIDAVEGQGQSWAKICITDTGIGLAATDLERVFEAFYQVKSPEAGKTPGTGLGLSLVKRMIELHGGKVWAESKGPGWGSRFVFTLPLPASPPGEAL